MADIYKTSSWVGSRFISRFSLMSLPKENRKLRLSLIRMLVSFDDDLIKVEDHLLSYKNDAFAYAFIDATAFLQSYSVPFFEKMAYFLGVQKVLDFKDTKKEEAKSEKQEKAPPEEDEKSDLEKINKILEHTKNKNVEVSGEESNSKKLEKIYKQLDEISMFVNGITSSDFDLPKEDIDKVNDIFYRLSVIVRTFYHQYHLVGASGTVDIDSLFSEANKLYSELLKIVVDKLNSKGFAVAAASVHNFDDIKFLLKKLVIKSSVVFDKYIAKEASTPVSRWLRKKIKSISPKIESGLMLEIVDLLVKIRDNIDKLIDALEDKNSKHYEINKLFHGLTADVLTMSNKMAISAKLFYFRQTELGHTDKIQRINITTLNSFNSLKGDLWEKINSFNL